MKRNIILLFIFFVILLFRNSLYVSFKNHSVNEVKVYSIFVSNFVSTNGYEAYKINQPYYLKNKEKLQWKWCNKFHDNIISFFQSYFQINLKLSDKSGYFVESDSIGYKAYIQHSNILFFIHGFPDFGGTSPNEEEFKICDQTGSRGRPT